MYEEGSGVAQNDSKAEEWFRKAAEQGDFDFQSRLDAMDSDKKD